MEHRVIREFTREYLITNFPRARTAPFSFPFAPREENRRCFEDGCIIFSPGFTTNSLLNRDDYACCSIVKRQKLVGIVYCEPRATEKIDEFSLFIYPTDSYGERRGGGEAYISERRYRPRYATIYAY